ncbi:MAG: hypothetical protein OXC44_03475, partial [Proteobacteria bacterium]|nr:hypothetical protein [Pseudomonadota bacterium]
MINEHYLSRFSRPFPVPSLVNLSQSKDPEEIKHFREIGKGIIEDYKSGKVSLPDFSQNRRVNIYDLVGG